MRFSPNLEADYQADLAPEKIRALKLITKLGIALYVSFAALDPWAIPSAYHGAWAIRGVVIAFALSLLAAATWRRQFLLSRHTPIVWTMYLIWGLGIAAMIVLAKSSDLAWGSYYCGMMLACSTLAVSYLGLLPNLTVGLVLVGAYIAVAVWIQGMLTSQHWSLLLMNSFFLISATIIGIVVAGIRERYTRELYLLRHALHRDVEMAQEAKRQSDFLAEHDVLTEMPNRIYFMRQLEATVERVKAAGTTVTVLFIDLDGFKPINDRHGHHIGDMVLRVVAQRIRSCVRAVDLVARFGGDEFVVAIEVDQRHLSSADRFRQSLGSSIAGLIGIEGSEVSVTASIGMAMYPYDANDAAELIDVADRRMYEVKRESKAKLPSAPPAAVVTDFGVVLGAADSTAAAR